MRFRISHVVVLSSLLLIAGCGGRSDAPKTVAVTGLVKYQGQPMPNLSVAFIPDQGMLAYGTSDAEGRFELTTSSPGDGAIPGTHKVSINFDPDQVPEMPGFPGSENNQKSPIPLKYGDVNTSGLTATVDTDSSKNDFTFELID